MGLLSRVERGLPVGAGGVGVVAIQGGGEGGISPAQLFALHRRQSGTASRTASSCIAETAVCASRVARESSGATTVEHPGLRLHQACPFQPGEGFLDRSAADVEPRAALIVAMASLRPT